MFETDWENNKEYFSMLEVFAGFSGLFSTSETPFLDYRLVENIFCVAFQAENKARDCSAFDARIDNYGVGIKTFILEKQPKFEKIAEFNKLKEKLDQLNGEELARALAEFRNERILTANRLYNVNQRIYHIVSRHRHGLRIFNTPYDFINPDSIKVLKDNNVGLTFKDNSNEYKFNRSKTVLMRKFCLPDQYHDVAIKIIENPFAEIKKLTAQMTSTSCDNPVVSFKPNLRPGKDYVILPLYSTKNKEKEVPEKSGLNQWNAGGRPRDENEIYIPIPSKIRHHCEHFFPKRDQHFILYLPDNNQLKAKVCQDDGKALMTDPNKELGDWLLRKIMNLKPGTLVTREVLNKLGFDSVYIIKYKNDTGEDVYRINVTDSKYESYENFIKGFQ